MGCSITRKNGKPVSIQLLNGSNSVIFDSLLKSPLISDGDSAILLYKEQDVKKPTDLTNNYPTELLSETGEPRLVYKSGTYYSTSLRNALKYGKDKNIQVGYIYPKSREVTKVGLRKDIDFPKNRVVYRTSNLGVEGAVVSDTNFFSIATVNIGYNNVGKGTILQGIADSMIAEEMTVDQYGNRMFYGISESVDTMQSHAMAIQQVLNQDTSTTNVTTTDGLFTFNADVVDMSNIRVGDTSITLEEFNQKLTKSPQQVRDDESYFLNLTKSVQQKDIQTRPTQSSDISGLDSRNSNEIMESIIELLTNLGIEVDSYVNWFNNQSKHPDVFELENTLSDVIGILDQSIDNINANSVSLLLEGLSDTTVLDEALLAVGETSVYLSHRESLPNQLDYNAERNIRINSLAELLTNFIATNQSELQNTISRLLSSVRIQYAPNLSADIYNRANTIREEVDTLTLIEDQNPTGFERTTVLFAPTTTSTNVKALNHIRTLKGQKLSAFDRMAATQDMLDAIQEENMWESAIRVTGELNAEIRVLRQEIESSVASGNPLSMEAHRAYNNLRQGIMPTINSLRSVIREARPDGIINANDFRVLSNSIQEAINDFSLLSGKFSEFSSLDYLKNTVIQEIAEINQWDEQTIDDYSKSIEAEQKDLNALLGAFGSLVNRGNPLLNTLNWIISTISGKANMYGRRIITPILDAIVGRNYQKYFSDLRLKNDDGSITEYLMAPIRYKEWNDDRKMREKEVKTSILALDQSSIDQINSVDESHLLVRNILVEALKGSSLSTQLDTSRTPVRIKFTDTDLVAVRAAIQPSLSKLNSIYGTTFTFDDLFKSTLRQNTYKINTNTNNVQINGLLESQLLNDPLELTKDQRIRYDNEWKNYRAENEEQLFNNEYYDLQERLLNRPENNGLYLAVAELKQLNMEAGKILSKYRVDGRLDRAELMRNPVDSKRIEQIERRRRRMGNPVQPDGTLTRNIIRTTTETGRPIYRAQDLSDTDIEQMTPDELLSWGMVRMSERWQRPEPYTTDGSLKPGLQLENRNGVQIVTAIPMTVAESDALSYADFMTWFGIRTAGGWSELTNNNVSEEYMTRLKELERTSPQEALQFMRFNSYVGTNETFQLAVAEHDSYVERVRKQIDTAVDVDRIDDYRDSLADYENVLNSIKFYTSNNRSSRYAGEVDFEGNELDMAMVRELETRLKDIRFSLPKVEPVGESMFEKSMNNAYFNELKSRGIEEGSPDEQAFLETHLTSRREYNRFQLAIDNFRRRGQAVNQYQADMILRAREKARLLGIENDNDIYTLARIEYLRDNVPAYFRKFSPRGFTDLMVELESSAAAGFPTGRLKPSDLIEKENAPEQFRATLNYVEVSPRGDWASSLFNEQNINNNYVQNEEYYQANRSKWINHDFFTEFGIDEREFTNEGKVFFNEEDPSKELKATRNLDKYEALRLAYKMRDISLRKKGYRRNTTPFRLPYISRTSTEKLVNLTTSPINAAKEVMQDFGTFRVDETDALRDTTGKVVFGLGEIRTIPRYFETELEDMEMLTEDILGSLVRDAEQSFVYEQRQEAETKVYSVLTQIEQQKFLDGVSGSSSETLKKAKEYVDAMIYGQGWNQDVKFKLNGRSIHLSKLLGSFRRMFSNVNLAFNPFVDITGMSTAAIDTFIKKHSQEYFAKSSLSFTDIELHKMTAELLKDYGKVDQSSKMIRILETFGVRGLSERATNTQYSRGVRNFGNSAYMGADISNLNNTTRLAVGFMKDHRLVEKTDGTKEFMGFNEFKRYIRGNTATMNLTEREVTTEFDKYLNQSLFELSTIDYGLKINDNVDIPNKEEVADKLQLLLTNKLKNAIELTDSVIQAENRTWMQRNPWFGLLTTHKGWLPINIDKALKAPQFNLKANRYEAGHYLAVGRLMKEAYQQVGSLNPIKILEKMKEIRNSNTGELDYNTYLNYVGLETAMGVILTAMGAAVLAATEDDDNKDIWAIQFAGLIYIRTLSEINSMTLFGLGGAIKDTIETPVVSADYLSKFFQFENWSLEEMKSGKYQGLPKYWAQLMKLTIGKRFYDVYDVRETNRAYRHWNGDTLPFLREKGFVDSVLFPWLNINEEE